MGQVRAGGSLVRHRHPAELRFQATAPEAGFLPGSGQGPSIHGEAGERGVTSTGATQSFDPEPQVRVGSLPFAPQGVPVSEERGDFASHLAHIEAGGGEEKVPDAGMGPHPGHLLPVGGEGSGVIHHVQVAEKAQRGAHASGGGGIDPPEVPGLGAPSGEFHHQGGQVGLQEFRGAMRNEAPVLRLGPQSVAYSRRRSTGSTTPLVGGVATHADRFQAGHGRPGIEAWDAHEPGIDHHPDTLDGQRGLGHRRGQDDLSPTARGRSQGAVLGLPGEGSVKKVEVDAGFPVLQCLGGAPDLGGPGEKDQDVALGFGQGAVDRGGHHGLDPASG